MGVWDCAFVTNPLLRPPLYCLWLEFQFWVSPLSGHMSGSANDRTARPPLSGLPAIGTPYRLTGSPSKSHRCARENIGSIPSTLSAEWFSSISSTRCSIWGMPGSPIGRSAYGNSFARRRCGRRWRVRRERAHAGAPASASVAAAPAPRAARRVIRLDSSTPAWVRSAMVAGCYCPVAPSYDRGANAVVRTDTGRSIRAMSHARIQMPIVVGLTLAVCAAGALAHVAPGHAYRGRTTQRIAVRLGAPGPDGRAFRYRARMRCSDRSTFLDDYFTDYVRVRRGRFSSRVTSSGGAVKTAVTGTLLGASARGTIRIVERYSEIPDAGGNTPLAPGGAIVCDSGFVRWRASARS